MESHTKNPGSAREQEPTSKPRMTEERRRRLVHAGERPLPGRSRAGEDVFHAPARPVVTRRLL